VLPCFVSPHLAVDISLGLDWTASIREWLIGLGQRPMDPLNYLHAVHGMSICYLPCLFSLSHTLF
jgi:hypothetical protein